MIAPHAHNNGRTTALALTATEALEALLDAESGNRLRC